MLKEVPCRFCQQPVPYSPIEEMEKLEVYAYWCEPCQAEYLYFQDSNHASSWSLYVTINSRIYRWTVSASGNAVLVYLKNPNLPRDRVAHEMEKLLWIAKGDPQPTITPQNIRSKVQTYLVFL